MDLDYKVFLLRKTFDRCKLCLLNYSIKFMLSLIDSMNIHPSDPIPFYLQFTIYHFHSL